MYFDIIDRRPTTKDRSKCNQLEATLGHRGGIGKYYYADLRLIHHEGSVSSQFHDECVSVKLSDIPKRWYESTAHKWLDEIYDQLQNNDGEVWQAAKKLLEDHQCERVLIDVDGAFIPMWKEANQ